MAFEVFYQTPIFSENGVAHSVHNGHGLKELKVKFYDQNNNI